MAKQARRYVTGGFAFSCRALSGITLSASQSTLRVCTQSASFCFVSWNKVPYLFVVRELFLRFTSLVLLTVIYVADKSIPVPQSRNCKDWKQPRRCSLRLSKAVVRDRSAEFSGASWAILRSPADLKKHFFCHSWSWNDGPHICKGCEHTWQLTAVVFPSLALAQQHW